MIFIKSLSSLSGRDAQFLYSCQLEESLSINKVLLVYTAEDAEIFKCKYMF